jgi:hypothetical protein
MTNQSWIYCGHANENPAVCPCNDDCICRNPGEMCADENTSHRQEKAVQGVQDEEQTLSDKLWNFSYATDNIKLQQILREYNVPHPKPVRELCPNCNSDWDIYLLDDDSGSWSCGDCGVTGPRNDFEGELWDKMSRAASVLRELEAWCEEKEYAIDNNDLVGPDDKYNVGMNHVLRRVLDKIRGK